jgi:hypothetical protein
MSQFSYRLDLYRIRYGSGDVTCLLAQSPEQARGFAARVGDTVVAVDLVPHNI